MASHSLCRAFISGWLFVLVFATSLRAASPGSSAFSFLKIDPAARPAAMGNTNSVISAQSSLENPAILPWIRAREISLEHLVYVSDLNYSLVNYVHPLDRSSALNIALGYLGMGGLTRTVADTNIDGFSEQGSFGYGGITAVIGFGRRAAPAFSWGVSLKAVQETIDNTSSSGAMFSAGGLYTSRRERYTVGFGVVNVGPQVKGFDLPSGAYIDIGKQVHPDLALAAKAIGYLDQTAELRAGLEYGIAKTLFLRAGYRYPLKDQRLGELPDVDITGGFGIAAGQFTLDYAWLPYGDLGATHRISLSTRFGETQKEDQVLGPTKANTEPAKEIVSEMKVSGEKNIEAGTATKTERKRIAVLEFTAKNCPDSYANAFADIIRSEIIKTKTLIVIDRTNISEILREQNFQLCGATDSNYATRIGKIANVEKVVVGSLSNMMKSYVLVVNVLNVETGEIEFSVKQKAADLEEMEKKCRVMAEEIAEHYK